MSFARETYAGLIVAHGPVVRVVVAEVAGSAPREVGASVVVWDDAEGGGQHGTIGGGTLEYDAVATARAMLAAGTERQTRQCALGPDLGQCCGGRVRLVWERLEALPGDEVFARPVTGPDVPPLPVARLLAQARGRGETPAPVYLDGWMVEPVTRPGTPVWIWGAGHVGRALIHVLSPLPDMELTWVDTGPERFPDTVPEGVTVLPAPRIDACTRLAPRDAHHVIVTYSHALDLALCDALLARGAGSIGLIGSDTKWARFRKRLTEAGHPAARIDSIRCPIGDKRLGKHPAAIALGVARELAFLTAAPAADTGMHTDTDAPAAAQGPTHDRIPVD